MAQFSLELDLGRVLVGVRRRGELAEIQVFDTGIGIPIDKLSSVFSEFTRLEEGAREAQGLGLGLSIVRQIIEAHGGRVWAENITDPDDPDHITGARFVITLTPLHTRP